MADRVSQLNWEAIRAFIILARTGSLRKASGVLGLSINTVRRHLDMLEKDLDAVLTKRGYEGVELTAEGEEFLKAVGPMETAVLNAQRRSVKGLSPLSGFVRVSVTEGIGTYWIMPRLVELQRGHPNMVIELNCTMRPPDLVKMEADIGVQTDRPSDPEMISVKLGRMHATLFASPEYLATFGRPHSLEDIGNHKIVEQIAPQVRHEEYDRLFADKKREGFVSIVTNTSSAHYAAVAMGAGIGMLPTYLWALKGRVEHIDLGYQIPYDIWLVFHRVSRRVDRISLTLDWLRDIFDPVKFPWFRDEYIPPARLVEAVRKTRVRQQFDILAGPN
ncbi:MAG: LysR family transcriptional regulator [Hyphomicrobiales bacterium]|nr:LysR family transcriptional regulator [Hyphomicrobiales bacterium]